MNPATATAERKELRFSQCVLTPMQIMEFRSRHVRGEPLRKLCNEFDVSLGSAWNYTRGRTQRLKLVASNLFQAEQALTTLPADERVDVMSLLQDMRTMTENLASAGAQSARSAKKAATLAREAIEKIATVDDAKATEHLATFNKYQDAAKKAAEVPVNIIAATRGNNLPTPPSPPPAQLPSDPVEQAQVYEDIISGKVG